ncbi:MAG: GNAT family N-acetyltransferase [Gammaproteobacteria bacterium]|nr:GNAT family N-acetyltransferase [Gammaproteobacteria bacterium]MCY4268736.1 GNAT family N-acetyltransferase [Gammaproteobacteria bacterium]MCY4297036.1 GNAT family N-acetyltransferase [Gammaproteobacteria bacterium]
MADPKLIIEPLDRKHDRNAFHCGEASLDTYIRRQASQDIRRRVAQTFVALGEKPDEIAGYYTLSAASFEKGELPAPQAKRLPHYPIPAVVIGRLAVAQTQQGKGLGEALLIDAANRAVNASDTIGIHAIIVDALNDSARAFYQRYGFQAFTSNPNRLFLPLQTFVGSNV